MRVSYSSTRKYMGENILYDDEVSFPSFDVTRALVGGHTFWRNGGRLTLSFVTDQLRKGVPHEVRIEFSAMDEHLLMEALSAGQKLGGQ